MTAPFVSDAHLPAYNYRLQKSIPDKLNFIRTVKDCDVYLDYGCGDAALLSELYKLNKDAICIGYDHNRTTLRAAAARGIPNSKFFFDYTDAKDYALYQQQKGKKVGVILSSILHELYTLYHDDLMNEFWESVCGVGFEYVFIRDMGITKHQRIQQYLAKEKIPDIMKVREKANKKNLSEFEKRWGNISQTRHFIHFMLKYPYEDNWTKENGENYLVDIQDLKLDVEFIYPYKIIFEQHYTPLFLKERIRKDFDFEFEEHTHYKLIVKRTE